MPSFLETSATVLFSLAIIHTFFTSSFQKYSRHFLNHSIPQNFLHLLGEVEVVFLIWASLYLAVMFFHSGGDTVVTYVNGLSFTEPLFVFAVMTIAATKPILCISRRLIFSLARILPCEKRMGMFIACLVFGPLMGSLITEPAAMTVTAILLRDEFFKKKTSRSFKYFTLGVLLVNVSIGGVLTSFAAPPVLMVAAKWHLDSAFMFQAFGWKAALAVLLNSICLAFFFRKQLNESSPPATQAKSEDPFWISFVHLSFLALVIVNSHHSVIFLGLFLLFLGFVSISHIHQNELLLRQSLLVASFLGGLIVLGEPQKWWLQPLIEKISDRSLFLGSAALTAITDNAALTFLGSQIPGVTIEFQYALIAGAVAGGGLTVIANAPNPAGFAILQDSFGRDRINPFRLFLAASIPTAVAMACFWFF